MVVKVVVEVVVLQPGFLVKGLGFGLLPHSV
jgi:hypothetical protein